MHSSQFLPSVKLRTQTSKQMMTTECGEGDGGRERRVNEGGWEAISPIKLVFRQLVTAMIKYVPGSVLTLRNTVSIRYPQVCR